MCDMRALPLVLLTLYSCASLPKVEIVEGTGSTYRLTLEQGIEQLASRDDEIEDAWIYHDGIWVDVGYDQNKTGSKIDPKLLADHIEASSGDLYFVHDHNDLLPPSHNDFFFDGELAYLARGTGKDTQSIVVGSGIYWEYGLSEEMEKICFSGLDTFEITGLPFRAVEAYFMARNPVKDPEGFVEDLREAGFHINRVVIEKKK